MSDSGLGTGNGLDAARFAVFTAVADHLIPAAHGMPSAGDVVTDDRIAFVLGARPDLAEPFADALRPDLGDDPTARLATLDRDAVGARDALVQVIVFGYYTDADVRARLGYPGQEAKQLYSWKVPDYVEEGLIEKVVARGPVWRDPATGQRAVLPEPQP